MWNETRMDRLDMQRKIAESRRMKPSDQSPSAITTDSTEPLDCNEKTRKLIQLRWDVAVAVKHAVKEYRNSLIVIKIARQLMLDRRSLDPLQPIAEP